MLDTYVIIIFIFLKRKTSKKKFEVMDLIWRIGKGIGLIHLTLRLSLRVIMSRNRIQKGISIFSQNVNGLRGDLKRRKVFHWLHKKKDVIFFL